MSQILLHRISYLQSGIYLCPDGHFEYLTTPVPFFRIRLNSKEFGNLGYDQKTIIHSYKDIVKRRFYYSIEYINYFWHFVGDQAFVYGKSESKEVNEYLFYTGQIKTEKLDTKVRVEG